MRKLPRPEYVDKDLGKIVDELKREYSKLSGKENIRDAQYDRLLINQIAYREMLVRVAMQETCRQNLVEYAHAPMLEYLGALVGISRNKGESDAEMRERIKHRDGTYITGGSRESYRYLADEAPKRATSTEVIDIGVRTSEASVTLYPLIKTIDKNDDMVIGAPNPETVEDIFNYLNDDKRRPLCEEISVVAPSGLRFTLDVKLYLYADTDGQVVTNKVKEALTAYTEQLRSSLGKDIVKTKIISVVTEVDGVYDVEVSGSYGKDDLFDQNGIERLNMSQWADCTGINVSINGFREG